MVNAAAVWVTRDEFYEVAGELEATPYLRGRAFNSAAKLVASSPEWDGYEVVRLDQIRLDALMWTVGSELVQARFTRLHSVGDEVARVHRQIVARLRAGHDV